MPEDESPEREEASLEGVVVRSTGSWHDVQVADRIIPSKVRGKFRLEEAGATNPVAVGDRVTVRTGDDETGLITAIHERRNHLVRRAAGRRVGREHVIVANVDRVWVLQAVRLPKPSPGFIDRVLVMAEAQEIPAGIVINKSDLMRPSDGVKIDRLRQLYTGIGYPVLVASARSGDGIEAFRDALRGRTSVLTGASGVGKSSLLNAVEPGLELKTGTISKKTSKGRHTTNYASLLSLAIGGYVVDTPGIREFGVLDVEDWELSHFFVEMKPFIEHCRFPTCTHDHEPGCAVKAAVNAGEITHQRYRSYLNILDSIRLGERDVGR